MLINKKISPLENIELKKYSTFDVGGVCKYFIEINNREDIVNAFDFIKLKKEEKEIDDFYILGMGSNTIFSNNLHSKCVLKINIKNEKNFEVTESEGDNIFVKACAGENWDDFVLFCCQHNYFGLENLSYIPGTVGAAPVQNIGAYGVEIKDYIKNVEVYDIEKEKFEILENNLDFNNLEFEYRDSIFKKNKNKYFIISITFILDKERNKKILYENLNISDSDSLLEIRNKIIDIRKSKLPEWRDIPNCGSFFKNPIITKEELDFVLSKNKSIKYFEVICKQEIKYKLSAAQIIDSLHIKGLEVGGAKVSQNHALIITNENREASFEDVFNLSQEIISKIHKEYKIILEREVNMI